jgi:ABC-type amino acid transport substrate-binding protein
MKQKIILSNTALFFMSGIIITLIAVVYLKYTSPARPKNNAEFVVGTAAGYAPFVSVDAQGTYEGFDIDIAQEVARRLGKRLVIKDLGNMTSLFIALDQGSIDAIIWGLSITESRLEKVSMVHYQGNTVNAYPLLFWNAIPEHIKTVEDMKGLTVCVEPASSQDAALNRYPEVKKRETEKIDDALLQIQYGKADAALVEPAIANKFIRIYPNLKTLWMPLQAQDQVYGVGIALRKGNPVLLTAVTQAIEQLKQSGFIATLESKWGVSS